MKKQTWRLIFLLSTFHWDTEIMQCKFLNEILDSKRMMFGKLWKEIWSFYAGHWWLFRITKTWSENRQQVEFFQFLVSKLSIARQNAVSQRNNILTDRNFIWFCGKNLGDTISLVKCSTVPPYHRHSSKMLMKGIFDPYVMWPFDHRHMGTPLPP